MARGFGRRKGRDFLALSVFMDMIYLLIVLVCAVPCWDCVCCWLRALLVLFVVCVTGACFLTWMPLSYAMTILVPYRTVQRRYCCDEN